MSNTISSSVLKVLKILIATLIIALPSCTDYLDVRPENQLLLEDFWQKESDVEAALMVCYRAMQEDEFMWRVIVWGELRSDNVMTSESAGSSERLMSNVNILPTNGLCSWTSFYKVINYCNTVLQYAPGVMEKDPDFTTADLQAKSAEALAIRALCHFYLLRTFRDIPLSSDATIDDTQNLQIPQSSLDAALEKITDDLLQAEEWAVSGFLTLEEKKGRITKDVIRAILADVYLWRKDYVQCIEYCDKLIEATTVSNSLSGTSIEIPKYEMIEEDFAAFVFYAGNSSESIFELQFSTVKANNALRYLFYLQEDNAAGHLIATTGYADPLSEVVFPATDERKAEFINVNKTSGGVYQIAKYLGLHTGLGENHLYTYKETTANWIFYRITDMMLMKAEALVQLQRSENDLKEALHIVNATYMRANPTLLETDTLAFENYGTQSALERLVLLERQRELMFEGKRWFDLVRHSERKNSTEDLVNYVSNKYASNLSTIASKLSLMNALYLPIHTDELKVNPLLQQNPYYQTSSNIEK
jgi:hypothetical protein